MENKKWYVVFQHAEDYTYGVVALTDDELTGAKKMLDYDVVVDGSWSGGFYIDDVPYDTEESRAKMSAINKGRKHSDVSRQHMSEAHIGKSNNCRKRKVICVETGIMYDSATDASKILNCSRSQICNALKNSISPAGGFHWERCE